MKWIVESPGKLSRFLEAKLEGHSGKFIRRVLGANLCRVNGKVERFASTSLSQGEIVELSPVFQSVLTPKLKKIEILYENKDFRIVNKPSGFVCSKENSLLKSYELVHRLDKDTTGLLILAKSSKAKTKLIQLFKSFSISKSYLALVDGVVLKKEGTIQSLLIKKGFYHGQTIWGSSPYQGLNAKTYYKVLETGKKASFVLIKPETGRTHQIRVHMAEMGHPILVDPHYARTYRSLIVSPRPLLHAYGLQFKYQDQEIDVRAPIPEDFKKASVGCFMGMRFLREPIFYERHEKGRNNHNSDEYCKEIEESSNPFHESCKNSTKIVRNSQ